MYFSKEHDITRHELMAVDYPRGSFADDGAFERKSLFQFLYPKCQLNPSKVRLS